MIEPTLELPITDQCQLLDVARSSYYYKSGHHESEENLALMQEIDRLYLAHLRERLTPNIPIEAFVVPF